LLPKNLYARKARENAPKGVVQGENAVSSYEAAAKLCSDKVAKIVKECRRVNQKYSDNHFNIEFDLKAGQRDCLRSLNDDEANYTPCSAKRVTDIFESPKFFSDGATANDIRQGRDGDCWLLAALGTLGNKPGLIEKICVARDETVGVCKDAYSPTALLTCLSCLQKLFLAIPFCSGFPCNLAATAAWSVTILTFRALDGFVFHRDGEWISEIIDDKLYLIKPEYVAPLPIFYMEGISGASERMNPCNDISHITTYLSDHLTLIRV
jgi:hypothetical protein